MLSSQGKVATHLVPREDKAGVWTQPRGKYGEENLKAADEVHIPDYVLYDFGFPRETAPASRRRVTETRKRETDVSDALRVQPPLASQQL